MEYAGVFIELCTLLKINNLVKNITYLLNKSALITKSIGDIRLKNSKKLRDEILFNGISLWDIAESTLALHIIPEIIASRNKSFFIFKKSILIFIKRALFFFKKRQDIIEIENNNSENAWLTISFSDYMYNDIFQPLNKFSKEQNIPCNFTKINLKKTIRDSHKFDYINENINPHYFFKLNKNLSLSEYRYIFNWLFNYFIPIHYSLLKHTPNIFNKRKINILITADNSDPRSRILCLYAKKNKIPVIELQFGQCDVDSIEWFFSLGDKVCVWGKRFKDILVNDFNHNENNVIVTGSPRFDYMYNLNKTKFTYLLKSKKIDNSKKIIILASTYTIPGYDSKFDKRILKNFKKLLLDEISIHSNFIFLVKPHPNENTNLLLSLTKNKKNIILLDKHEDLRNYIPYSNALISFGSTVNYDAIINSKIIISPTNRKLVWYEDFFIDNHISIGFNDIMELRGILNRFDLHENSIDFSSNNFLINSIKIIGKPSSQEIVTLINNIILN